ncbi:MAG: DEAD/DEAH box helicase [Halarcobacter sp.]
MENNKLYKDADSFIHNIKGFFRRKFFNYKKIKKQAQEIYSLSLTFKDVSDEELESKLRNQKDKFLLRKDNFEELKLTFALISETSFREIQKRPYPVQIMGALAMYNGYIIEMATGEGKTITACIATIALSWRGEPCHIITSNDYLASRDAQLLAPLYNRCFVEVGYITNDMENEQRVLHYQKDVVYATSNDILADYLRDKMKVDYEFGSSKELLYELQDKAVQRTLRPLHTVIIDEADSVLADEAITPLIISIQTEDKELLDASIEAKKVLDRLEINEHYEINKIYNSVEINESGFDLIKKYKESFPLAWRVDYRLKYIMKQAILAKEFYHLNKQYVIVDDKIVIVDEKTGRLMNSRSWSGGLHQAVEAKEGIPLTKPTKTNIKMSFQRFFRLYKRICGMSGTLQNIEKELWQIYYLTIVKIPLRVSKQIQIYKDEITFTKKEKWDLVAKEIEYIHSFKRPILVGARTILEANLLERKIKNLGLSCTVLHALNHEIEAQIIEKAGEEGSITIATNMAGRGTDIILLNNSNSLGGLHVIVTERNESRRVDLQLFGRAGRQGQKGSVKTFLSVEDELLQKYMPSFIHPHLGKILSLPFGKKLIINIYIFMQQYVEKISSKKRILNLINEQDFLNNLTFTKNK